MNVGDETKAPRCETTCLRSPGLFVRLGFDLEAVPLAPAHAGLEPSPMASDWVTEGPRAMEHVWAGGSGRLADPGSRSHPGLCVPENQFSPRMGRIREPWCHPYLLSCGSTLRPGNTESQPPKCLQIGLSPRCRPQPQGCASREGFSCSQKCSPVLFTQHNSDIQGRGWVTAGTASLQHLPQVSGLTWKRTDPESGEDRHQSAPLLQPAWGPSTPTTCSPYHSHRPALPCPGGSDQCLGKVSLT